MSAGRQRLAALAVLIVTVGAAFLAIGLRPSASPALLADPSSPVGTQTPKQERAFGDEPIIMSIEGDLATRTLVGEDLLRLVNLEGKAAALPGVRSVYGPGTFLNASLVQIEKVLQRELGPIAKHAGDAARRAAAKARAAGASPEAATAAGERARIASLGPRKDAYLDLLVRLGSTGIPSLSNRNFVLSVVFGAGAAPKERFSWLFPDAGHALVLIRPEPGLEGQRLQALGERLQRLADDAGLDDVDIQVAGVPLLVAGIADSFAADLLRLSPVLALGLVLALFVGFRGGRRRLRLLAIAAGGVLLTAAASRVLGLGLTPATVAALPIVLGIAVDFGVQLQARYRFERGQGAGPHAAAVRARTALAPVLGLAAAAMGVGFLTLTLSSIPLIDRLGITLAVGTALSLGVVLLLGPALMAWRDAGAAGAAPELPTFSRRTVLPAAPALAVLAGLAVGGLVVSGGTKVQSDLEALAPKNLPELTRLQAIEKDLKTGGVLRLAVTGEDVLSPRVLQWQRAAIRRAAATDRRLRPGPNVGDLLTTAGRAPTTASVQRLVKLVPRYFLDAVVTRDAKRAEISFGVPTVPVREQGRMLARVQAAMRPLPDGIQVTPTGLLARGVQSVDDLEGARPGLLLAALAAVALLLAAVRRDVWRTVIPLVPTVVAAGVSALALRVSGVELSPLGAGLEPLVLAVGVEFGLLLEARYHEARVAGAGPLDARDEAVRRVGGAVAVSAVAVAVGFAALAASRLELLQQFGLLVAFEVLLCAALAIWLVPALSAVIDTRRVTDRQPATRRNDGERVKVTA
ncbi:MAG: superfamily protein-like exporter [Solirubrobacterales bacterium]|nr:superfamily protein-like exporter [Solirubrobacterales bacterium]